MSQRSAPPASSVVRAVAVTLLAFALRTWRLDYQALWWDEGYSVFFASQGVSAILAGTAVDIHPPLYYLLLRGWAGLSDWGSFSIRFLSVWLGVLTVPLLYGTGCRLFGRRSGWLAAVALAVAPFHIHHSQEARMYTLVPFLAVLSTYLLARWLSMRPGLESDSGLFLRLTYLLSITAALYSHYYAVLVPVFHGFVVLAHRSADLLRRWVLVQFVAVLLYLPWVVYLGPRLLSSVGGKVAAEGDPVWTPLTFAAHYVATALAGYDAAVPDAAIALLAALALVGCVMGWSRRPRGAMVAALWLVIPLAAGWALNLRFPFNAFPRLLSFAAPGLYLLTGAGLAGLARRSNWLLLGTGTLVTLLLFPVWQRYYAVDRWPDEDYRPLVRYLQAQARPDDVVICDFPWQAGYILSYLGKVPPRLFVAPLSEWAGDNDQMSQDLAELLASHGRVWYPAYQALGGTRGRNIEAFLTQEAYPAEDRWYGHTRLLLYGSARGLRLWETDVDADFAGQVRLLSFATAWEGIGPGDVLPVSLRWQVRSALQKRYKVFVHLLDTASHVVAQRDAEPHAGAFPTTDWLPGQVIGDNYGLLLPADLSPGDYFLEVGLYDRVTGERLPTIIEGQPADDKVRSSQPVRIGLPPDRSDLSSLAQK